METKKLGHGGILEGEDMIYPGDWCDGSPVGAYFGGVQMVCYRSAGLLQPIWLAQRWRVGCVPPLSDSSQLELRSLTRIV